MGVKNGFVLNGRTGTQMTQFLADDNGFFKMVNTVTCKQQMDVTFAVKQLPMTETELIDNIIARLAQKEEIKYIKADALTKGFTLLQFDKAYEDAQLKIQVTAKKDPFIRLFLGPTLLIIAGVTFYTNFYGKFWGVSTFIGLLALAGGLRLTISLVKQYAGKR